MDKVKNWNYKVIKKIGEGGFGQVYLCKNRQNRQKVAIKMVSLVQGGSASNIIREVTFLSDLNHDNIVRLLDVKSNAGNVYLVFEYLDLDLVSYITSPKFTRNPVIIKAIVKQILAGLSYIHSRQVLHRDLKPNNLLIDLNNNMVKLADFGLAREFNVLQNESCTRKIVGSAYKAPELLLGSREFSTPTDVWAAGCIFGEMVIGRTLFPYSNEMNQLSLIFRCMGTPTEETWPGVTSMNEIVPVLPQFANGNFAEEFFQLEAAGLDLLSRMLRLDPSQRITATEALEHEYLQGIENVALSFENRESLPSSSSSKFLCGCFGKQMH